MAPPMSSASIYILYKTIRAPPNGSALYISEPVSRVLSCPACAGARWSSILPGPLLARSSDLTRSDTDVVTVGASDSWIGTYLVLLRVEIGRLTLLRHPTIKTLAWLRRGKPLHSGPWSCEAVPLFGGRTAKQTRLCHLILVFRRAAVNRYAAL